MVRIRRRGNYPRGARHPRARLTPERVAELRTLRERGVDYRRLAEAFGISVGAAWAAAVGVTWGHLPSTAAPRCRGARPIPWLSRG